jgi:SAM-dependent methyltransferase
LAKDYADPDLQRLYDKDYFRNREDHAMWIRRAQFVKEKFHPENALDVGCATGKFVYYMNDLGINAYGIDDSDYALSQVDKKLINKFYKVNLNSDPFPFEDNFFDFIGSFYSVEHIHNIKFFSKEMHRTLKNDGLAWFLTPNLGEKERTIVDVNTNKFTDWEKIFSDNGFNVQKFSPHEMLTLKGKLKKFGFYKLPSTFQNIIKKCAYDISNFTSMKDTSFILTKN